MVLQSKKTSTTFNNLVPTFTSQRKHAVVCEKWNYTNGHGRRYHYDR